MEINIYSEGGGDNHRPGAGATLRLEIQHPCLRRNLWGSHFYIKKLYILYMGFGKDGQGQILWDTGANSLITLGALAVADVVS